MSELTKKQAEQVDAYGLEMLKNGIKSGIKTDRKFAKKAIDVFYQKYLDLPPPENIIFVDSPEQACVQAAKPNKMKPHECLPAIVFLNFWSWWVAYYSAGIRILKETKDVEQDLIADLEEYEEIVNNLHAILPCEKACFVIEYPKTLQILGDDMDKFLLHRDGGMALEYHDGTGFSWLNGVEVPDWIAAEAKEDLDVKKIMAESNVDVRREGLRRVPFERFLKETGAKLLDKLKDKKKAHWDYQLYDANFGDGKTRRMLRMFDVASKGYPVERVEDSNASILEALAWRDDEDEYIEPSVRT